MILEAAIKHIICNSSMKQQSNLQQKIFILILGLLSLTTAILINNQSSLEWPWSFLMGLFYGLAGSILIFSLFSFGRLLISKTN